MQKRDLFYIVIIGVLVLILILKGCGNKDNKVGDIYNYTTDTTYTNKKYQTLFDKINGLEEKVTKTPPKQINIYDTPDSKEVIVEKIPDSILVYIKGLKDSLRIALSDKYIKNYPLSNKLIDFKLTHDEFNITTLTTSGIIKEEKTPLLLNKFNYYWNENNLYREERDRQYSERDPNTWNQLYINGGYDLFHRAPKVGLDYSLKLGRFRFMVEGNTTFQPSNIRLEGLAKIGYRLLQ